MCPLTPENHNSFQQKMVVLENKGWKPGAMDLLFASPQTSNFEAQEVRSLADAQV